MAKNYFNSHSMKMFYDFFYAFKIKTMQNVKKCKKVAKGGGGGGKPRPKWFPFMGIHISQYIINILW